MSDHVHPETGELLATDEDWREALRVAEEKLSAHYRVVWALRDAVAERTEPAAMPERRRDRSEHQERVLRCPRCGGRLPNESTST